MNRKIFTLLACCLVLLSTALSVNAQRRVAEKSVGDSVTTLLGSGPGMYHIRIDSIRLPDYVVDPSNLANNGHSVAIPVSYDGGDTAQFRYLQYDSTLHAAGLHYRLIGNTTSNSGLYPLVEGLDTMILSVTESGHVAMISASDLRVKLSEDKASLLDLQATMWCINIEDDGDHGQWPTYHFTNKVYGKDLDWKETGKTVLDGNDEGWMYSPSYLKGSLKNRMPFYRDEGLDEDGNKTGTYRVIMAELDENGRPTGLLKTERIGIDQYIADTVPGMLKFSVVKISPFVMTAEDFNTQLGNVDAGKVLLSFNPKPSQMNYFGYKLSAEPSKGIVSTSINAPSQPDTTAHSLGYLNLRVYNEKDEFLGYIANSNKSKTKDSEKYNNVLGKEYLNLLVKNKDGDDDMTCDTVSYSAYDKDDGGYNYSYRFVYFPTEDSIVINAYYVKHDRHNDYLDASFVDNGRYKNDKISFDAHVPSFYYGLYNGQIHDYLTVIYQDLSGIGGSSLMTIDKHPTNIRMFFGINSCQPNQLEGWVVPKGVYTIWDSQGRCLGVRIYNGSYSPQWMVLDPGECPDRIPSYQWVIQPAKKSSTNRVDIINREFGDLAAESKQSMVNMLNVKVVKGEFTQIFGQLKGQFLYNPIIENLKEEGYEPIVYSYVYGGLLPALGPKECVIKSESGFRPVTNGYVTDRYLGYKHFHVDHKTGKSEDIGYEKGMDYNAYAFNYFNYNTEQGYIDTQSEYTDTILHISKTDKTAFQFMLGTNLRNLKYQEELFGYPRDVKDWKNLVISDPDTGYEYTQDSVPVLERYYYELKVADFYNYRDGLAEEFVVLKGAKADGSDIKNQLKYGLADIWAEKDPYKFANVYLRESYFLPRPLSTNEERHELDTTRRIFYALLDRIEATELKRVTEAGLEVSDTLMGADGTTKYNLVSIKVEDAWPSFLIAQGKTVSSARVSVFALENFNYPLYRRLRSMRDDDASLTGDGIDPEKTETALDAPKTLRIYREADPGQYLYEDALSDVAYNYGINFLGHSNISQNPEELAPDGTVKYNYHLFIDTAYINRGTGLIKPQYLIAVGQHVVPSKSIKEPDECGDLVERKIMPYVEGRYLINATDSARFIGSDGSNSSTERDKRYIYAPHWDRLAFVPAIHVDDRLYIVSELQKRGIARADYTGIDVDGQEYVDGAALRKLTEEVVNGKTLIGAERRPENSKMYGAYYDFGTWDNYHNDVCFSLRFVDPGAINPNDKGEDAVRNVDKRFLIESETYKREVFGNKKIAPVQGGWIKLQHFVPVLSRTSYDDAISLAEIFNVEKRRMAWQDGQATSNEAVADKCCVISGTDEIAILNAAGKQMTVTNLLGQTLVNKALKSNNEKVRVAKGIVIVNIEGEEAVKSIVK